MFRDLELEMIDTRKVKESTTSRCVLLMAISGEEVVSCARILVFLRLMVKPNSLYMESKITQMLMMLYCISFYIVFNEFYLQISIAAALSKSIQEEYITKRRNLQSK